MTVNEIVASFLSKGKYLARILVSCNTVPTVKVKNREGTEEAQHRTKIHMLRL